MVSFKGNVLRFIEALLYLKLFFIEFLGGKFECLFNDFLDNDFFGLFLSYGFFLTGKFIPFLFDKDGEIESLILCYESLIDALD